MSRPKGRYHPANLIPNFGRMGRKVGCKYYVALAMLNERLCGVQVPLKPEVKYNYFTKYFPMVDDLEEMLPEMPESFQSWIKSPQAFTEISPHLIIPEVASKLSGLEVSIGEIADMFSSSSEVTALFGPLDVRALLWWHLIGMPTELLAEMVGISEEEAVSRVIATAEVLSSLIGFHIFAQRVEVACILGGNRRVSYLKRLILASEYVRSPINRRNSLWRRCIMPIYFENFDLLRRVAGTARPYKSPAPVRTRPWEESIG